MGPIQMISQGHCKKLILNCVGYSVETSCILSSWASTVKSKTRCLCLSMPSCAAMFKKLKGGTFYERDVYYYSNQITHTNPNMNSGNSILYNFKNFAELQTDLYQYK